MSQITRLNPRTASPSSSIWTEVTEETFRRHIVQLEERTNAVPVEPQVFSLDNWVKSCDEDLISRYSLPIAVEQQVANHVAFIAAVEEGAQSVAAVCLEECLEPVKLNVWIAAVDVINEKVSSALLQVLDLLSQAALSQPEDATKLTDSVFQKVLQLHFRRILGRLRSSKWEKPTYLSESHKKPLWQDFDNLIHRAQFMYTKKEKGEKQKLVKQLINLEALYKGFEHIPDGDCLQVEYLSRLILSSLDFCKSATVREYCRRLEGVRATSQVASALKCLRQIEKIAAYRHVSLSLVKASIRFPHLFSNLTLDFLTPYSSIPTSVANESWAKTCHVHAEIQLLIDLDFRHGSTRSRELLCPRVMGTSKHLCYLCYLFVRIHGKLFPAKTHGRLYDQWTVPDLEQFDKMQKQQYSTTIQEIDQEVVGLARMRCGWRAEPMTSRQDLSEALDDRI